MIPSEYYRLADYKIIEGESGNIWWETHSGFCSVKMGRCFVNGSILFIEPGHTSEESGFLKGEFLDQLNRWPRWEKTNYYCTSFNIIECKADQELKSSCRNNQYSQPTTQEDVSYRLGRFEIIEKKDGMLLWRSYSGRGGAKVGKAFVEGNILFFGRGEAENPSIIRKNFLERLSLLSNWEKTRYFCQQYTLYNCKTNSICYEVDENLLTAGSNNDTDVFRKRSPRVEPQQKAQIPTGRFLKSCLKSFWLFSSILILFILNVLIWFIRIIFKALKLFLEACSLGGKRLLNSILKLLK